MGEISLPRQRVCGREPATAGRPSESQASSEAVYGGVPNVACQRRHEGSQPQEGRHTSIKGVYIKQNRFAKGFLWPFFALTTPFEKLAMSVPNMIKIAIIERYLKIASSDRVSGQNGTTHST